MYEDDAKTTDSPNRLNRLIDEAFHAGPAMRANELIYEVRQRFIAEHQRAFNYEVSLLDRSDEWTYLCEVVSPLFSHYLTAMGFGPKDSGSVFVSLFYRDTLYFIRAEQVVEQIGFVEPEFSQSEPTSLPTANSGDIAELKSIPLLPVLLRRNDGDEQPPD